MLNTYTRFDILMVTMPTGEKEKKNQIKTYNVESSTRAEEGKKIKTQRSSPFFLFPHAQCLYRCLFSFHSVSIFVSCLYLSLLLLICFLCFLIFCGGWEGGSRPFSHFPISFIRLRKEK